MVDRATSQSDNISPPRRGAYLVQAVDTTARPYQLALLPLGGKPITNANQADHVYLTLGADGGDVYLYFSSVTASDLDDTAANAAGTPWTATTMSGNTTYCEKIASGTVRDFRIERSVDRWIVLKTSTGTANLRFYASSQPEV